MTEFTVYPPSRRDPTVQRGCALQQDRWNDFSFQTLYHLYVDAEGFSGRIGPVKILRRGQTSSDGLQVGVGTLSPLSEDFVSLGQDLDYYERLAGLPDELRREILAHLRDALANPEHAATFFEEPGWRTSILRDIDWDSFGRDASVLLQRDYDKVAKLGLALSFQVNGWANPLSLRFDAPRDDFTWGLPRTAALPERIAVLTGRNGSGKSTLLARLARVLHASQRDRARSGLRELGSIDPPGIGFMRVVNVAYSAFDTFQIPGVDEKERRQIADEVRKGTGRYHFCGLRDIARELQEEFDASERPELATRPEAQDRQHRTILKSVEQLSEEFQRTVEQIWKAGRQDLFAEVSRVLASDPSFQPRKSPSRHSTGSAFGAPVTRSSCMRARRLSLSPNPSRLF